MKTIAALLFLVGLIGTGHAQNKVPATFRDYLIPASHLDSLKKVERTVAQNPQSSQYLHLLIAIELGKLQRGDSITTQQYNKIVQLATRYKSQLGLAMANYMLAQKNAMSYEDIAYTHILKAQKQFAQQKDTTGILHCYRLSAMIFSFLPGFGPLSKEELASLNRDNLTKLISLSQKSQHPIDKYIYCEAIVTRNNAFEMKPTEPQIVEAFRKANELIDKNSYLLFLRRYIYRAVQQGYSGLKRPDKVLEYGLQTLHHPDIKAGYWDYRNVANTYINLKKHDSVIVFSEEALKHLKTEYPNNLMQLRELYKNLKVAYFKIGNLAASIKADSEYDKNNELIHQSDRRLAVFQIREKYSVAEKEAELKRLTLERKVVESRNKLLKAQYDAEKHEAALKTLSLENQATESRTKLLKTQMEVVTKESAIQQAESQKRLLFGGLLMTLLLVGIVAFFSVRLRKTNVQLLELQAGRDKFYTILAHDLRSPMNSLNDMGAWLPQLIRGGEKQEMEKVIQQIENMRQKTQLLLNNLFEWGKSQYFTKDAEEVRQQMDVVPLLRELYQTYLPFAEAKKIAFTAELPFSVMLTVAPKGLMMTVRNLLDNALKNTRAGGRITIGMGESAPDGDTQAYTTLYITDTGKGIASDQLHYLQQVFSGKIKPEVGIHGLGLGMVLIHHFVQQNKATLDIESEAGKGTRFSLRWEVVNEFQKHNERIHAYL